MRFISILLLFMVYCNLYSATPTAIQVVNEYAENLKAWSNTKDVKYSQAIEALCSNAFRVNDDIIDDYVSEKNMTKLAHYDFNDYELCLKTLISKGSKIKISNIKVCDAPEFAIFSFGHDITYISGDVSIEGTKNFYNKELFYINNENNKIEKIRNHDSDYSLRKAFNLCKQKKFEEAYDVFENLIYTSNNYSDQNTALNFAISILLKKGNSFKMPIEIRKYKLSRNLFKSKNYSTNYREGDYPILDETNFDYYLWNMQSLSRDRVSVLPPNWQNWIPYTRYKRIDDMLHYRYYKNVFSYYRTIERRRYAIYEKKAFGYMDENGKIVISPQYRFAYPFDEKAGIALVQYLDKRWGYIDMYGTPLSKDKYDVASDVYVNGKTWVIKDCHLVLIDSKGKELKSIYGYTDLSHKLDKNVIIAANGEDSLRYDLFDFEGNLIQMNCIDKSCKAYKDYNVYSLYGTYYDIGGCTLEFWGGNRKQVIGPKFSQNDHFNSEQMVDLGLSVLWAGYDYGTNTPLEIGIACMWGDPTGTDEKVMYKKSYNYRLQHSGGDNPPATICGTGLDVAKKQWGEKWRLPNIVELQELIDKCSWKMVNYNNVVGYIVTGPNGNSIFIKSGTLLWSGDISAEHHNQAIILSPSQKPILKYQPRDFTAQVRAVCAKWTKEL